MEPPDPAPSAAVTVHRPTLVVLAAGASRRFGRLKQLESVGPAGEILMDYGLFDAARAGFREAVVVVRPEIEEEIRDHLLRVVGDGFPVRFAHQESGLGRTKPWGTAHALLSARQSFDGPFGVCNADDFYGSQAFERLAFFLRAQVQPSAPQGCVVAYRLGSTLMGPTGVSRATLVADRDGRLARIEEMREIAARDGRLTGRNEVGEWVELSPELSVSTNLWGFTPELFSLLEERFRLFATEHQGAGHQEAEHHGPGEAEFLLSEEVGHLIDQGALRVEVVHNDETFFGVTSPEDREPVVRAIRERIARGEYSAGLAITEI